MSEISVKEALRDIANTFDDVDKRVLLWTNGTPTSNFNAGTVSLDLTTYDAVEVEFVLWTSDPRPCCIRRGFKGQECVATTIASNSTKGNTGNTFASTIVNQMRAFTATDTGVTFTQAVEATAGANFGAQNHSLIPYKIYGIQLGASAGDGSSSGTMNYPDLLHKPTINGVTLVEGLVTEDLNLGDTAHEEVTQAEFNALTPEERDDGTVYFVKDGIIGNVFLDDNTPIGTIAPFGGTSDPSYWLICDGRAVSRTDYAALFGVIGTTYGAGDGSTTFNIPDLRGRTAQGAGTLGEETYTLGDSVDAGLPNITGAANVNQSYSGTPFSSGSFAGAFYAVGMSGTQYYLNGRASGSGWSNVGFDASRADSIYGNSSTVQPNAVITNYIIKYASTTSEHQANIDFYYPVGSYYETSNASFDPNITWGGTWVLENEGQVHVSAGSNYMIGDTGGEATHKLTVAEMPSHTHGHYYYGGSGATWGYNYSNGSSTKSAATEAASGIIPNGGGGAHNNMQPYIVVNRWHRTA